MFPCFVSTISLHSSSHFLISFIPLSFFLTTSFSYFDSTVDSFVLPTCLRKLKPRISPCRPRHLMRVSQIPISQSIACKITSTTIDASAPRVRTTLPACNSSVITLAYVPLTGLRNGMRLAKKVAAHSTIRFKKIYCLQAIEPMSCHAVAAM